MVLLRGRSWDSESNDGGNTKLKARYLHEAQFPTQIPPSNPNVNRDSKNNTASTFLPVCYAKNETCAKRTNNCSGHGRCYLKYTATKGSSTEGECWACKCQRTVERTNDDGSKKTTEWGGNACQKKDVSMPFWLLGGISVLLVVGISLGVSLLYSIGNDELPGVLGAGVVSARPPK